MDIFRAVKAGVSTEAAATACGIQIMRNSMCRCPFHGDHTPSMKIYKENFYCFGCGFSGDVIDFTAKFYGLSKINAAKKLAADFSISYEEKQIRPGNAHKTKKAPVTESPDAVYQKAEEKCLAVYEAYLGLLREWKSAFAPDDLEGTWNPLFIEALKNEAYVEYLVDTLREGELQDRMLIVIEKGKEVIELGSKLGRYATTAAG